MATLVSDGREYVSGFSLFLVFFASWLNAYDDATSTTNAKLSVLLQTGGTNEQ